jgi:hypothetical protein
MSALFTDHTVESAPPAARRAMTGVHDERGYVPAAVARMAASPQLLDGFLRLSKSSRARPSIRWPARSS